MKKGMANVWEIHQDGTSEPRKQSTWKKYDKRYHFDTFVIYKSRPGLRASSWSEVLTSTWSSSSHVADPLRLLDPFCRSSSGLQDPATN